MTGIEVSADSGLDLEAPDALVWSTFIIRLRQGATGGGWSGQIVHEQSQETRYAASLSHIAEFILGHAPGLAAPNPVEPKSDLATQKTNSQ